MGDFECGRRWHIGINSTIDTFQRFGFGHSDWFVVAFQSVCICTECPATTAPPFTSGNCYYLYNSIHFHILTVFLCDRMTHKWDLNPQKIHLLFITIIFRKREGNSNDYKEKHFHLLYFQLCQVSIVLNLCECVSDWVCDSSQIDFYIPPTTEKKKETKI